MASLKVRQKNENSTKEADVLKVSDWIWDIAILDDSDEDESSSTFSIAVGMAHHQIEIFQVSVTSDDSSLLLDVSSCSCWASESACLVTAMHLNLVNRQLHVAVGTQFCEVLVWKPLPVDTLVEPHGEDESNVRRIVKETDCLRGHKGIVHSVRMSNNGSQIVSTSDDRSVRLWDLDRSSESWHEVWTGWGHTDRVWDATFSSFGVVSTAEDGTTRLWKDGKQLSVIYSSSPCNWRIEVLGSVALVGGNDGLVATHDLSAYEASNEGKNSFHCTRGIQIPDDRPSQMSEEAIALSSKPVEGKDIQSVGKKRKKTAKKGLSQVIVGIEWINPERLLVSTRSGSILQLFLKDNKWEEMSPWWDPSMTGEHGIEANDGCCMSLSRSSRVAIGTTRGSIVLMGTQNQKSSERIILASAKAYKAVQSLHWVSGDTLVSFHVRVMILWKIDESGGSEISRAIFSMDTPGVPMSFVLCPVIKKLVIGDSRGYIGLFEFDQNMTENQAICPTQKASSVVRAHHKEHVTGIIVQGHEVISVGNDGQLRTCYIRDNDLIRGISLPVGGLSGIVGIWSAPGKSRVFVKGYYGNTFVVLDPHSKYEYLRFDTEGRQRICKLLFDSSACRASALAVCVGKKDGTNELTINRDQVGPQSATATAVRVQQSFGTKSHALHGDTIFSANTLSINGIPLLLTGSEDCSSLVSTITPSGEIDPSQLPIMLTPQESCVRSVSSSQIDESTALLVVGGGKRVLQFFLLRSCKEDKNDNILSTRDNLEVFLLGHGRTKLDTTIDHRISAVASIGIGGKERWHFIVAGDSNGVCQAFLVSEDFETRRLDGCVLYTGERPIISIQIIQIQSCLVIIFGTTEGDVKLLSVPSSVEALRCQWDNISDGIAPLGCYKAHQMGTNSISAMEIKPSPSSNQILVCSGGDDQAICLCLVSLTEADHGLVLADEPAPVVIAGASSSAIKGLKLFNGGTSIVTVGYSQVLAFWKLRIMDGTAPMIDLVDQISVDVGDVNCLAFLDKVDDRENEKTFPLVAIGGSGVELLAITPSN